MDFLEGFGSRPARLGILAGSFNPPTIAHLELVVAARGLVDEVLYVLPKSLPHKEYFGATWEQRLDMLRASRGSGGGSIATTEQGLFVQIARDCREHYGPETRLYFLCGADAAERILSWDYGRPGFVKEMLREFELLIAPRGGVYQPPEELSDRLHPLPVGPGFHEVSSTEVRERVRRGAQWEHLVPPPIVEVVREIYS